MGKYLVEIREVHVISVMVEATNEDDAREKANELLQDGNTPEPEYSHTLDVEDWGVIRQ